MDDPISMLAAEYHENTRYLGVVQALADATAAHCHLHNPLEPDADVAAAHRLDATAAINAFIGDPELLWKLLACCARFEKQPPPHIDELKQSFSRLAARRASPSDGSGETTSFDF